jgi:hypothetical protein
MVCRRIYGRKLQRRKTMQLGFRFGILAAVLALGILGIQAVHAVDAQPQATDLEVTLAMAQSEAWEGERVVWQVSLMNSSDKVLSEVKLGPAGETWFWPEGAATVGALSRGDRIVLEVPAVALESGEIWPTLVAEWMAGGTKCSLLVTAGHSLLVRPVREAVEGQVLLGRGTVYRGETLPLQVQIANSSPFSLTGVALTGQGTDLKWEGIQSSEDLPAGETRTTFLSPKVVGDYPRAVLAVEFHWIDAADRASTAWLQLKSESAQIKRRIPADIPWSAFMAIAGFLLGWLTWWLQHRKERSESQQVNCERVLGMLSLIQVQARHGADEGTEVALDLVQKLFSEEGLYAALERLEKRAAGVVACIHDIWQAAYGHNTGMHHPDGAPRTEVLRRKTEQLDVLLRDLRCGD